MPSDDRPVAPRASNTGHRNRTPGRSSTPGRAGSPGSPGPRIWPRDASGAIRRAGRDHGPRCDRGRRLPMLSPIARQSPRGGADRARRRGSSTRSPRPTARSSFSARPTGTRLGRVLPRVSGGPGGPRRARSPAQCAAGRDPRSECMSSASPDGVRSPRPPGGRARPGGRRPRRRTVRRPRRTVPATGPPHPPSRPRSPRRVAGTPGVRRRGCAPSRSISERKPSTRARSPSSRPFACCSRSRAAARAGASLPFGAGAFVGLPAGGLLLEDASVQRGLDRSGTLLGPAQQPGQVVTILAHDVELMLSVRIRTSSRLELLAQAVGLAPLRLGFLEGLSLGGREPPADPSACGRRPDPDVTDLSPGLLIAGLQSRLAGLKVAPVGVPPADDVEQFPLPGGVRRPMVRVGLPPRTLRVAEQALEPLGPVRLLPEPVSGPIALDAGGLQGECQLPGGPRLGLELLDPRPERPGVIGQMLVEAFQLLGPQRVPSLLLGARSSSTRCVADWASRRSSWSRSSVSCRPRSESSASRAARSRRLSTRTSRSVDHPGPPSREGASGAGVPWGLPPGTRRRPAGPGRRGRNGCRRWSVRGTPSGSAGDVGTRDIHPGSTGACATSRGSSRWPGAERPDDDPGRHLGTWDGRKGEGICSNSQFSY